MKRTIVGTGYVRLSNAVLLFQNNKVVAIDINQEKIHTINTKKSPIDDAELIEYLTNKKLDLIGTTDKTIAYKESDSVVVATPTNYDTVENYFDTSSVEYL